MNGGGNPRRRKSLWQIVQYLVRRRFWGAHVARSAWIDPTASIDRTHPAGIHIADDVWIGPYAMILSHDMSRGLYASTHVGARSHVGARAVIMPGVTVGADCVIAPGSAVSRDVPAGSHVAGNPARPLRAGG